MCVLMYYSNKDVRVQEMPVPKIGPGELLMRVVASGICGSDVMEWYRRDKVPLVLGHEVAGEVVEVGEGVDRFKPGDRIAATHHVPCNTCHYCLSGHHTVCKTLLRGTHFDPGGFAEYIRVPAINVDRGTFHIPDGISYQDASFMEPLACVLRGQKRSRLQAGQSVLVLGAGIAGLLHVGLAHAMGAGRVMAADTITFRMDMAKRMGAHHVFRADESLVDSVRRVNNGYLADLVILCFDGFLSFALQTVEKGGTVLVFSGAAEDATLPGRVNDIFWRREVTITSTYAGSPADCWTALKMIQAGVIPIQRLISMRLPLKEGGKGFKAVANPLEHECIKVILEP
ncbi:MAG: alcohol dehydrogenase catalytic domain-containing protein [Deltaproteobacteria bacterium]|nr:alcohol dehydrogenase catalytic domain-containing protein [Deltaproteobacteria bacterium]